MKKYILISFLCFAFAKFSFSQSGNFTATFTSNLSYVKPVTISFTKPVFKFDNTHGYWFLNPTNNYKHFNIQPEPFYADRKEEITNGIAFITLNNQETDFDLYSLTSNDSNSVSLQRGDYIITAPKYDVQNKDKNKPMHIHINNINAKEISFTLSGTAALSSTKGYAKESLGTITGSGHFYREAQYAKSDSLPGCNCDPTIYATVYDEENNVRTASAAEKAFNNKLFDAVQKAMSNLFTNVDKTNNIIITMLPGCADINVPVKERPYCFADFYHNGTTTINAHKKIFSNDDRFGLRFIHTLSNAEMGVTTDAAENRKIQAAKMDSVYKLMAAKKITMEEYGKALKEAMTNMGGGSAAADIKKLEAENNLYIHIIINASNKTETDLKLADKNKTVVTHNIKGAAFEIFSPLIKDGDGDWVNSRQGIYFGKFSTPTNANNGIGFDVKTTNASYPVNANKLSVYNIIIKMEGGKDLVDKAIANIDFNALQNLITKQ